MHSEMILFETQQRPEGYRIFGTEAGAYTAYHSPVKRCHASRKSTANSVPYPPRDVV